MPRLATINLLVQSTTWHLHNTQIFPTTQKCGCCCQSSSVGHGVCPCNWIHHLEVLLCSPCLHLLVDWRHHCWICVPSVGKMHSGKANPLTCFGGRTGLWFSYHCHIEAFGATVPSPSCVKSSSSPRRPVGGATRHHMHHRYPLRLHHCMAFHDRPHPLILPWLANPYLCLRQCLLDWCMYSFQVWFAPVYVTDVPRQEGEDPSFQRFKNRPQLAKCHHRHFWTRPQLHKRQHRPFAPSCH